MAKKVIISESQLNLILNQIKEDKKPLGFLTEDVVVHEDIIQEGWKDIVLGVALLAGIGLTGQNKAMAQNAVNDPKVLTQVQNVLQDERLEDVVDSLEAAGMSDAMDKIQRNARQLERNFEAKNFEIKGIEKGIRIYHGKEIKQKQVNNYEALAKKLKAGYAIQGISQDTISGMIDTSYTDIPIIDSLSVTVDAGNYFGAGDYILSEEGRAILGNIMEQIKAQDGVIIGIRIESSTDKQRISSDLSDKLENLGYERGNQGLSGVRNDQLKKELMNLGVDSILIDQDVKFNQGQGEDNAATPQDGSARYVKLIIDAIHIDDSTEKEMHIETVEDVIKYNFDLVKIQRKKKDLKLKITWGSGKGKVVDTKCSTDCPFQNKKGATDF